MIDLHPKAIEHFNQQAEKLLYLVKPAPASQPRKKKIETSDTHKFVKNFPKDSILKMEKVSAIDGFGRQLERYFHDNDQQIGFRENDFKEFEKLVLSLLDKYEISALLSKEFLEDTCIEWIEKRYKGIITNTITFIDHLLEISKSEIINRTISIPVNYLEIQEPFSVGKIKFDYFTKDYFDNLNKEIEGHWKERPDFDQSIFDNYFLRFRKQYQGKVFASAEVIGDKRKCIQIAISEAEQAITIIRFFSPTALIAEIPSYFGLMGKTKLPEQFLWIFENDQEGPEVVEEMTERRRHYWTIDKIQLGHLKKLGLDHASELITKEKLSQLEELLLNSITLFTRALKSSSFHDKIVFALVSVETIFLKNSNEPIQQNIGQRLAFLLASNYEDRKSIIKTVQDAYMSRSSFIHHGNKTNDIEMVKPIQMLVWSALRKILFMRSEFDTQEKLIQHLEKLILS